MVLKAMFLLLNKNLSHSFDMLIAYDILPFIQTIVNTSSPFAYLFFFFPKGISLKCNTWLYTS